jgi:hypothetical protein
MDILAILDDHLRFIERFYNKAAEPFETMKRKIEAGEEPFVPRRAPEDYDGPEYEIEWIEADECLSVLGSTCLGLLAKALQDYLRLFIMREAGVTKDELAPILKLYPGHWFQKYCAFLEDKTSIDWRRSPISRDQIEQVILTRNDLVHDWMIGATSPRQSEEHFGKHPASAFADELGIAESLAEGRTPELPLPLKVTREKLVAHIEYVRKFCTFVEAHRTAW